MAHLWLICALGAAILWGISYALSEELVQRRGLPPSFLILIESFVAIPLYIILAQTVGSFKTGITVMFQSTSTLLMTIAMGVLFMVGNFLIMYSISLKNATMTSFIEISYPLFTILFVWLFFGKIDMNISTAIGALLIVSGVGVMYLKG